MRRSNVLGLASWVALYAACFDARLGSGSDAGTEVGGGTNDFAGGEDSGISLTNDEVGGSDTGASGLLCQNDSNCVAGQRCGFTLAMGCAGTGECVEAYDPSVSASCYDPGGRCGCDGQYVDIFCGGAGGTTEFTSRPANRLGPCPSPVEGGVVDDSSIGDRGAPSTPSLVKFEFIVDGVVQAPLNCPAANWEFPPVPGLDAAGKSVLLKNTGQGPLAYIAHAWWSGTGYRPGVATGEPNELVGVLNLGEQADITSVYMGGTVALLGSASPFSSPGSGKYAGDEGVVPWPAGVAGSGGAAQMWLAEIEIETSCMHPNQSW